MKKHHPMKSLKNLLGNIGYCFKISWNTSIGYTVVRILSNIFSSVLPLIGIYLLKAIIDILARGQMNNINTFLILILGYFVVQVILQWLSKLSNYFQQMHNGKIENYLNRILLDKSAHIDLQYFDCPSYYDRLKMMRYNSIAVTQIIWDIISVISGIVALAAALIVMVQYSPIYSVAIIVSYLPLVIYDQLFTKKIYTWQLNNVGEERKLEYITNLLVHKSQAKNIRIFGTAEYLMNIYSSIWTVWFNNRKVLVKKWAIVSLLLTCAPQIITSLLLIEVGINILNGNNSIGDFSLYSGMLSQLVANVFFVTSSIVGITENKIRVEHFRYFADWENVVEGTGSTQLESIGAIQFLNVSFTYPGNSAPTLKNISVTFKANERIALVGINGAGKSTLVKLLLRFYDASEGKILVNGIDVRNFTPESIRRCYSVMLQDYANFAFTLRENIKMSDIEKNTTDETLFQICRQSGLDISKDWQKGLDTYLYKEFVEDGKELSGGENQKVALARTFFRDGDIVILDEPSSSLDPESEHWLFNKMLELCENKGVILITHRLSNVVIADRILVIENGQLIEDGSHKDLMELDGRYAALFRYQAENYLKQEYSVNLSA